MKPITRIEKHPARAAEARRRIARAAALDETATTRTDSDVATALAGARAFLWLAAGTDRHASRDLITDLCRDFGGSVTLSAAITVCQTQPPDPKAWLRHACRLLSTGRQLS